MQLTNAEKLRIQEISEICTAYELGYVAGVNSLGTIENEYPFNSDEYFAWILGHNSGIHSIEANEFIEPH